MANAVQTAKPRLGIAELMNHEDFQVLSPQQQSFVARYISNGVHTGVYDALDAAKHSYDVSPKNAAALAAHLLGHRKIKRVLDRHFGLTERNELDVLLPILAKAIKRSIRNDLKRQGSLSIATTKALEFFERQTGKRLDGSRGATSPVAEHEGGVEPAESSTSARFAVGDIAILDGKQYYRVTAVNPDGSVSEADPL